MKKIIPTLLSLTMFGCMATGPKFANLQTPKSNESVLYLYRPTTFNQSGIFPDIYVNDSKIGSLKNGGFLTLAIPSGPTNILVKGDSYFKWVYSPRNHQFNTQAGQTYFYRLDMNMLGGSSNTLSYLLSEIQESIALEEMKNLNESVE